MVTRFLIAGVVGAALATMIGWIGDGVVFHDRPPDTIWAWLNNRTEDAALWIAMGALVGCGLYYLAAVRRA